MPVRRQTGTLIFNTGASSASGISAPPLTGSIPTNQPAPTLPPPQPTTPPVSSASPVVSEQPGAATSTSTRQTINLGTVIGACLGAFAFLILIIILVVWHSRRSRKISLQSHRDRQRNQSKRETWNKLSDGNEHHDLTTRGGRKTLNSSADSRRSSFESKPSIPYIPSTYSSEALHQPKPLPSQFPRAQPSAPQYLLPSHPYTMGRSPSPPGGAAYSSKSAPKNPFADPSQETGGSDADASSLYSTVSNPFESIYPEPRAQPLGRGNGPEAFTGTPFFTPHPDHSAPHNTVKEKWGSVGKERNVQQTYASSANPPSKGTQKMESLIAALDLSSPETHEATADTSMHGHLDRVIEDPLNERHR